TGAEGPLLDGRGLSCDARRVRRIPPDVLTGRSARYGFPRAAHGGSVSAGSARDSHRGSGGGVRSDLRVSVLWCRWVSHGPTSDAVVSPHAAPDRTATDHARAAGGRARRH